MGGGLLRCAKGGHKSHWQRATLGVPPDQGVVDEQDPGHPMRFVTVTCVATAFECIFRDKTVKAIITGDRPSKTEGANRALVLKR